MSSASVLITGGTGMIGSHLAGRLAQDGYDVTVLGRGSKLSLPEAVQSDSVSRVKVVAGASADLDSLEEFVKDADVIFHKAVSVGMAGAVESARDYVGTNIIGTAALVDALRLPQCRVKRVVLGSSVSVYGEGNYHCSGCATLVRPQPRISIIGKNGAQGGWEPPCPHCGGQLKPVPTPESAERKGESIYAVTKKTQEDLLVGICRQRGIGLTIMRYSTVLGPGQSWHNPFTRVLEMLAAGESPLIHEDGMQTRDFIFVQDLVEANILVLKEESQQLDAFNVSTLHQPLLQFVQHLSRSFAEKLGRKPVDPVLDGKLIAGDVRHCWVNSSRMQEMLGFQPTQDLHEGTRQLIDWFVRFKGLAPVNKV